jgi:DNA-binding NarL/FixJ family response regulator
MAVVRVLVVGPDPLARGGIRQLLEGEPGLEVTGDVAPERASREAGSSPADAVAWDAGPEDGFGEPLGAVSGAGSPVVALLAGRGQAREALGAGATGLLLRDAPPGRLAAALRAVATGLWALDGPLGESLLPPAPSAGPSEPLTPRELEVLALLGEGLPNKAIADRLGIAERTAKFHASAILAKLGAESRSEAIVRAARLGLLAL